MFTKKEFSLDATVNGIKFAQTTSLVGEILGLPNFRLDTLVSRLQRLPFIIFPNQTDYWRDFDYSKKKLDYNFLNNFARFYLQELEFHQVDLYHIFI